MSRSSAQTINQEFITLDDIWRATENGRTIFEKELGKIPSKNISAPWRKDSSPSFGVYKFNGMWFCKDQGGDQFGGTAIQFISKLYNISFRDACAKVTGDLNITKPTINYEPRIIHGPEVIKEKHLYEFNKMPFAKRHHAYFNKYFLPEEFLATMDIYACKKIAMNRKIIPLRDDWCCFAYGKSGGDVKFLLIGEDVPWKWRTNVSNSHLWYFDKNKQYDDMWVVKSNKDAACLKYHFGLDVINTQNESAMILLENNMERIQKAAKRPILNYGSDKQAYEQMLLISFYTGWDSFETPHYMEEKYGLTDVSDCIEAFGPALIGDLLKEKGFL